MSEGRDADVIEAIGRALSSRLHAARRPLRRRPRPQRLHARGRSAGARRLRSSPARARRSRTIDMRVHKGAHPCIGALDVVPIVYLRGEDRELAHDEALAVGEPARGRARVPVFLYGELAGVRGAARARLLPRGRDRGARRAPGGGELEPDFGPPRLHPTAGATLVAARPPLVAFNLELDTTTSRSRKRIAAEVREAGGGLPGVRAIGVRLERRGVVQVSTNVHDPFAVPLARRGRARCGARPSRAARDVSCGRAGRAWRRRRRSTAFPTDVPLRGFDEATAHPRAPTMRSAAWRRPDTAQRKHRGTQAGTVRRAPARRATALARPRHARRAEQRARSGSSRPPTWRGAAQPRRDRRRSACFAAR